MSVRPIVITGEPVLHRAAYEELGLTGWSYDRFELDEAALPGFVGQLGPEWAGLSVTMPGNEEKVFDPNADVIDRITTGKPETPPPQPQPQPQ